MGLILWKLLKFLSILGVVFFSFFKYNNYVEPRTLGLKKEMQDHARKVTTFVIIFYIVLFFVSKCISDGIENKANHQHLLNIERIHNIRLNSKRECTEVLLVSKNLDSDR